MFDINAYFSGVNNIRSNKDYVSNNYLPLSSLQTIGEFLQLYLCF